MLRIDLKLVWTCSLLVHYQHPPKISSHILFKVFCLFNIRYCVIQSSDNYIGRLGRPQIFSLLCNDLHSRNLVMNDINSLNDIRDIANSCKCWKLLSCYSLRLGNKIKPFYVPFIGWFVSRDQNTVLLLAGECTFSYYGQKSFNAKLEI